MEPYLKAFFDMLRRFAAQRTVVVPAICAVAALIMHIRGLTTTDAQMASIQHEVAAILDLLFIITGQSAARFSLNSEKICQTDAKAEVAHTEAQVARTQAVVVKNKVEETAAALNTNTKILDPNNSMYGELVQVEPMVPTVTKPPTPEEPPSCEGITPP